MLNIAIIEDNPQYRTTLSIILQLNEKLRLIHKLDNCDEMIVSFEGARPDVVMMDINLPGMNGIQAVWEIRKHFPQMKVIMLTVFEDDENIFKAIKAGANGYLLKKDSPQKILDAIEAVVNGEFPMNGMIAAKILDCFQQMQKRNSDFEEFNLTSREREILSLLIKGYSYKELAAALFISVETLNSHVKNIYRKLDIHSRSELAAKYGNSI